MKTQHNEINGFQELLERKQADLLSVLRNRDGIAIEKSADQMDEIQYATERDLAIRNVDRESNLLRDVKDALRRIREGSFGACIECESAISPKRLAAVAHRTAAEHNEKGDNETGNWHAQRALDYSDQAYKLAKEAHGKSGQIVSI